MGTKANPTVIGAFIVGAVVLIVAAVLVFGGGTFFVEKNAFVLYFDGSVNGLNVGAPVKFRGVEVGTVIEVRALYNPKDFTGRIQVVVEIEPTRFRTILDGTIVPGVSRTPEQMDKIIARGLRAQLQVQSMVTGLLFIDLDFHPKAPLTYVGLPSPHPELPTVPTTLEELFASVSNAMQELGKLPVGQILDEIVSLLKRLNGILTAPEMDQALKHIGSILADVDTAVADALGDLPVLVDKAGGTADAATAALQAAQQLVQHVESQVDPLTGGANATLRAARSALHQGRQTLVTFEQAATPTLGEAQRALAGAADLVESDSVVMSDVSKTLVELEGAARAIRILAQYLERNPQSLLRGKGRPGGR